MIKLLKRTCCAWFAVCWLVFIPALAQAQCDFSPWIGVWPEAASKTIQPKQIFLFSGNGRGGLKSQATGLQQFGGIIRVYLWSVHDSVNLEVLDQVISPEDAQYGKSTQLLLQPSRPLLASSEYELRASRGSENLFYLFENKRQVSGQRGATAYRWRTAANPDLLAPRWTATPAVKEKKHEANSEGLNNYVLFTRPLLDSSQCLVRATVRHGQSGKQVMAYLTPQEQLGIGWFTCGGNVRFKSEEAYTVRLEAIDAVGNRSVASGAPIPFRAPKRVHCCW